MKLAIKYSESPFENFFKLGHEVWSAALDHEVLIFLHLFALTGNMFIKCAITGYLMIWVKALSTSSHSGYVDNTRITVILLFRVGQ